MEPAVSVRELDIAYGGVPVVRRLDLDVRPGEFLVLLGPSGCGKSTLLNAIAGLVDIDDGEIWISERNVTWAEPKDRGIGMVFQSYALYPRMSVERNLSFGLRVAGVAKPEIARRVGRAAALLQIEPLMRRRPVELSGGQRQRVAIGRALVRDVDVFLFDEPLSNLDAKLRNELRVEIKKLHQRLGNTMIYVTHDQVEAMTLADRIAVMKDGVIQQLAPPIELYNQPRNLFVAGFVGAPAMNFLTGRLTRSGVFHVGDTAIDVSLCPMSGEPRDCAAVLGIRPVHLALDQSPDGRSLPGTVAVIEPMGSDTVVWIESPVLGAGNSLGVRTIEMVRHGVGDPVTLGIDMPRASLFDAANGERL